MLRALLALAMLLLAACGGQVKDGPPARDVDVSMIPDAVPRYEPITRAGNKNPYRVLGKTYHLLPSSKNYRARGLASWYGTKFHGNMTSNGEKYDMYAMTAAHKTLPIPCYVQVTNLHNGRKVIVRVNDRGPFHDDRIIDLSYAAAKKLGIFAAGTAEVEVVAIDPAAYQRSPVAAAPAPAPAASRSGGEFLQVGAFSSRRAADNYRRQNLGDLELPSRIRRDSSDGRELYKVLVGPFAERGHTLAARDQLRRRANMPSFIVAD